MLKRLALVEDLKDFELIILFVLRLLGGGGGVVCCWFEVVSKTQS